MFCHKCGKENENTKFCIHCGAELPQASEDQAVSTPMAAQPIEPVATEPPMAAQPVEPVAAEQPIAAQPVEPTVSEPFAAQPIGEQPVEPVVDVPAADQPYTPYMGEPPVAQPQSIEPYASEPTEVQMTYNQPGGPYMGEPPLVQMMSMQPDATPRKKKKTGLIIGIIAAALVVLVGAAALLYFMMTFPVEGQWYSEDRGEVLVFGEDGVVDVINMMGQQTEEFTYSRLKGEGTLSVGKESYDFESEEEEIYIDGLGTYVKAGETFAIAEFMDEFGWLGTWYSEERGEVLVFNAEGALECTDLIKSQDSTYAYSYQDGSGSMSLNDASYDIAIKNGQMNVSGLGSYKMADSDFDSAAFIAEFGQLGTWYSEERGEVLVFDMSGIVKSRHKNNVNNASFEFDPETFAITMTIGPFSYEGKIENGQLVTDSMGTFVQADEGFDEDTFFEDFGNSVLGIWYDKKGEMVIDLHDDGTYNAFSYGTAFSGEYTPQENGATVYFVVKALKDFEYNEKYSIVSGELVKDDPYFTDAADSLTREAVTLLDEDDAAQAVLGTWSYYSVKVKFTDETHVTIVAGSTYNGTYTYDPLTGLGLITLQGGSELFIIEGDIMYFLDYFFTKS